MKGDIQYLNWVEATLLNDENSSDDDMHDHFMKEGCMTKEEADFYISQRNDALMFNIRFRFKPYSEQ